MSQECSSIWQYISWREPNINSVTTYWTRAMLKHRYNAIMSHKNNHSINAIMLLQKITCNVNPICKAHDKTVRLLFSCNSISTDRSPLTASKTAVLNHFNVQTLAQLLCSTKNFQNVKNN